MGGHDGCVVMVCVRIGGGDSIGVLWWYVSRCIVLVCVRRGGGDLLEVLCWYVSVRASLAACLLMRGWQPCVSHMIESCRKYE